MVKNVLSTRYFPKMTISPISSSMMSMYVPSAVTSRSDTQQDYEYMLILQELAALGIAATGDKTADKTRLDVAKRVMEQAAQGASSSKSQSIPFEDIMNTLNIAVTGNLEKDYQTTIDKLDYEITMAYSEEEKSYYQALKDEVESDYISSRQSSVSTAFVGASQLGSLNRLMFGL